MLFEKMQTSTWVPANQQDLSTTKRWDASPTKTATFLSTKYASNVLSIVLSALGKSTT